MPHNVQAFGWPVGCPGKAGLRVVTHNARYWGFVVDGSRDNLWLLDRHLGPNEVVRADKGDKRAGGIVWEKVPDHDGERQQEQSRVALENTLDLDVFCNCRKRGQPCFPVIQVQPLIILKCQREQDMGLVLVRFGCGGDPEVGDEGVVLNLVPSFDHPWMRWAAPVFQLAGG